MNLHELTAAYLIALCLIAGRVVYRMLYGTQRGLDFFSRAINLFIFIIPAIIGCGILIVHFIE